MSKKKNSHRIRIKKGDQVMVISGNERANRTVGRVLAVYPETNKVLVEGVNVVRRAYGRRTPGGVDQPGFHDKGLPIHVSNVMLVDPSTGEPTRVGMRIDTDSEGRRRAVRVAKASGNDIQD